MKIIAAEGFLVRIPMRLTVKHSLAARSETANILVRLRDDAGNEGWGEGVPRPYVTGEDPQGAYARLTREALPQLTGAVAGGPADLPSLLDERIPRGGGIQSVSCAVETALLDLAGKAFGLPASAWIGEPVRGEVRYAGVIPFLTPGALVAVLAECAAFGFRRVKVKVGDAPCRPLLMQVIESLGEDAAICVDANGAWDLRQAETELESVRDLPITWVEQPLARGAEMEVAALASRCPFPLMADESLVTPDDAERLADSGGYRFFNLRLSKLGGMRAAARVAAIARDAGIGIQLGCQVGETAILSAAGRLFAATHDDLVSIEGSFGTRVLSADLASAPFEFGPGGVARVQEGPGLGISVDPLRVAEFSRQGGQGAPSRPSD